MRTFCRIHFGGFSLLVHAFWFLSIQAACAEFCVGVSVYACIHVKLCAYDGDCTRVCSYVHVLFSLVDAIGVPLWRLACACDQMSLGEQDLIGAFQVLPAQTCKYVWWWWWWWYWRRRRRSCCWENHHTRVVNYDERAKTAHPLCVCTALVADGSDRILLVVADATSYLHVRDRIISMLEQADTPALVGEPLERVR
jgi:hypothetical protein